MRFLLVGGSNTLVTAFLVAAFSFVIPGPIAFTIAFALGLVYSVLLTSRWVFSSFLTRHRALLYIGSYGVIYFCGLGVVVVFGLWGLPPWANGASVLLTAPLSFIAGRLIFTRSNKK
ncbi:GtrA family protein [Salinibacterium sp. M195]|uniref:GtrA family protein n=1 Tax=Salinibacterium sp. M195 TaxID=2583374 RepID=UPI001C627861|nr:GtrA family protein [Salinibacterium sp. M195]QYH36004.1 hypothetical protein FFT87_08590 [Salinibacterium sp. M195]